MIFNIKLQKSYSVLSTASTHTTKCMMALCQWQPVAAAPGNPIPSVVSAASFVLLFFPFAICTQCTWNKTNPRLCFNVFDNFSSTHVATHNAAETPLRAVRRKEGGAPFSLTTSGVTPDIIRRIRRIWRIRRKSMSVAKTSSFLPSVFVHVICHRNSPMSSFLFHIPPSKNVEAACDIIHTITMGLQTKHPEALL